MNEYYLQFSNAKYLKKIRKLKSMTLAIDLKKSFGESLGFIRSDANKLFSQKGKCRISRKTALTSLNSYVFNFAFHCCSQTLKNYEIS